MANNQKNDALLNLSIANASHGISAESDAEAIESTQDFFCKSGG
jgi:hypothetical protein